MYGPRECIAYPMPDTIKSEGVNFRLWHVSLCKDPGFGSMDFFRISREQINFIDQPPAVKPYSWTV